MGDWERIFGVGTGDKEFYGSFDEPAQEYGCLESGAGLPDAPTLFDLTGQIWHPSNKPCAKLSIQDLAKIKDAALKTMAEIEAEVEAKTVAPLNVYVDDWGEIASIFLTHIQRAVDEVGPSFDHIEACLISIVELAECDLVLARDTSPKNGHISRTLSNHIIAFPDEYFIARLGDMTFRGPFCTYSPRGAWSHEVTHDSFCGLADEDVGRKVLAVSSSLLDETVPILTVADWVEANSGNNSPVTYDAIAERCSNWRKIGRTWTDASETELRERIHAILAALFPKPTTVMARLSTRPYGSKISKLNVLSFGLDDPIDRLVDLIFHHIDVSHFRAHFESIRLVDDVVPTEDLRLKGTAHLMELFHRIGVDASAARRALEVYDYRSLLLIVEPRALDDDYEAP